MIVRGLDLNALLRGCVNGAQGPTMCAARGSPRQVGTAVKDLEDWPENRIMAHGARILSESIKLLGSYIP